MDEIEIIIEKEIKKIIDYYSYDELVWAQEEPRNMGAWGHLLRKIMILASLGVLVGSELLFPQ